MRPSGQASKRKRNSQGWEGERPPGSRGQEATVRCPSGIRRWGGAERDLPSPRGPTTPCRPTASSLETPAPPAAGTGGLRVPGHPQTGGTRWGGMVRTSKPSYKG